MNNEPSYLTRDGEKKLREELAQLKGPAREELAARLRFAIQQGDLSENADYSAAKEDQAFLEGRIQELERILGNVIFIDEAIQDTNSVNIGANVTVREAEFPDEETYFLVGPKEADPAANRISYESPFGKALLGHRVGDEVVVQTPGGDTRLRIIKITY